MSAVHRLAKKGLEGFGVEGRQFVQGLAPLLVSHALVGEEVLRLDPAVASDEFVRDIAFLEQ